MQSATILGVICRFVNERAGDVVIEKRRLETTLTKEPACLQKMNVWIL